MLAELKLVVSELGGMLGSLPEELKSPASEGIQLRRVFVLEGFVFAKLTPLGIRSPDFSIGRSISKFTDFLLWDFSLNGRRRPVVVPKIRR